MLGRRFLAALLFASLAPLAQAACAQHQAAREAIGAGEHIRAVRVDGHLRLYRVVVPDGIRPDRPAPVILAFHGGGGTARHLARTTRLGEEGTKAGFIVVFPQGYRRTWNAGDCCGGAHAHEVDDVEFVLALLDHLADAAPVDRSRVYATGFSNGTKLTWLLGCEIADQLAAIAPVAGAISIPPGQCRPARALPVLYMQGEADRFAPARGGESAARHAGAQRTMAETLDIWVRRDHCRPRPVVILRSPGVRWHKYPGCSERTTVQAGLVAGLGHQWPGTPVPDAPQRFGPPSDALSATEAVLRFFSTWSRRANPAG